MATLRLCSIPDCGKHAAKRGWCSAHYQRWLAHGDPQGGKTKNGEPLAFYRSVVLTYRGNECLIWPYARGGRGYGKMSCDGGLKYVHRLVCEEEHGPPPATQQVAAHSCGNGHLGCVSRQHLSWKTHAGNMSDMVGHGTRRRGDVLWAARLTEDDVRAIRAMKGSVPQLELASRFNVRQSNISKIQNRKAWAWLE
jgi:hypothetical protein